MKLTSMNALMNRVKMEAVVQMELENSYAAVHQASVVSIIDSFMNFSQVEIDHQS